MPVDAIGRRLRRPYPELWDAEWLSERTQKQSMEEIAQDLGCNVTTVYNAVHRMGVSLPPRTTLSNNGKDRPWQLDDLEWMEEALKSKSCGQIGKELGASKATVVFAAGRLGIVFDGRPPNALPWEEFVGQRFGLLVVTGLAPRNGSSFQRVSVDCDCGGSKDIALASLVGHRKGWDHCGCLTAAKSAAARAANRLLNPPKPGINDGECSVADCTNGAHTGGKCQRHYKEERDKWLPLCGVIDQEHTIPCDRPVASIEKGLCSTHYSRLRRYGDPCFVPSRRRVEKTKNGYRTKRMDGVNYQEHTWVMMQKIGRNLLPDETVHHMNGERDDNRPENLELWDQSHPPGQRVKDKVAWCREFLATYGDMFPEETDSDKPPIP